MDALKPHSETVRGLVTHATQRLLGDTIMVSEEDWRRSSRLPGWTRAHVATHLARQADAFSHLVDGALAGERREMYAGSEQRDAEIDAGADRTGLELQVDLDTSAGRLAERFDRVEEAQAWEAVVVLRGGQQVAIRMLPVARLSEVVLHHVDLDIGFGLGDVDDETADLLLEWCALRLTNRAGVPRLQISSTSGLNATVPGDGPDVSVHGSSAQLVGWLTGRSDGSQIAGSDGVVLPPY
jgi:maleylpyruvate isomerase